MVIKHAGVSSNQQGYANSSYGVLDLALGGGSLHLEVHPVHKWLDWSCPWNILGHPYLQIETKACPNSNRFLHSLWCFSQYLLKWNCLKRSVKMFAKVNMFEKFANLGKFGSFGVCCFAYYCGANFLCTF